MKEKVPIDREQLYFDISQELNISINDVRSIIESQFKGSAKFIRENHEIMLPYFGKFVKHKSVKRKKEP